MFLEKMKKNNFWRENIFLAGKYYFSVTITFLEVSDKNKKMIFFSKKFSNSVKKFSNSVIFFSNSVKNSAIQ